MRLFLCMLLFVVAAPLVAMDASNVLIVANEKAEGSVEIAEYYAKMRGITSDQLLKISASDKEEITRDEYNKDILEPIKKYVLEHDNILAIVPTRGVPLKVKETDRSDDADIKGGFIPGRDFASVDGELALIRQGDYEIKGAFENPWLNAQEPLKFEDKILVVSRLDGPTVEIAKGLVEKAILAEALGCYGESFLDTRGPNLSGGYKQRDDIMVKVADAWDAGKLKYVHDVQPQVIDLSTRTETLHYYGWYAGSQKPKGAVKFRTGGICIHLHSFSAGTIRVDNKNWVGPLLSWNATCSYGTVYEPLTVGFPYENLFWDRLVKGWSFGEAGQASNQLLSWQAVFCGDPLYTPYPDAYAEKNKRYRDALLVRMVPPAEGEGVPVDETGLVLMDSVQALLQSRADAIKDQLRKNPKGALDAFNDLRFLVSGMDLGDWLSELSGPFNAELERRFDDIKKEIKDDLTNTASFEQALADWKGLPIYEELESYKAELTEDQEKEASKLVKKAQSYVKSERWLKGWSQAAEAVAHKFAASAVEAQSILDDLNKNAAAVAEMKSETDKELAQNVERAQKEFDKGKPDRAAKYLPDDWRWLYPESDQYKAALALDKKIREALAEEK
ncbi:MAG: TIGR03790 family protein [Planctomycetes bacterium]|nr:TIGR03790 family protein [Planctomycetota bacterium]